MQADLLQLSIEFLKGVGPQRAVVIRQELGIATVQDLLYFFPNRYLDRTRYYKINELQQSLAEVQIIGQITSIKEVPFGKNRKRLVATFADATGVMELVWFQGYKYLIEKLIPGKPMVIFGRLQYFNNTYSMPHPEIESLEEHKIGLKSGLQAVYPSTEKLNNRGISNRIFSKALEHAFSMANQPFEENLPLEIRKELRLVSKSEAMVAMHFPKSPDQLTKAESRLKFEELFFVQLQLITKNIVQKQRIKGYVFNSVGENFNTFYHNHLPFELTNAQKRVVKEIRKDMATGAQMNRLLQGDVGSGKTIVALLCMILAKDNGFQSCLMAPTEILANQHFSGLTELAKPAGLNIRLLTGSTKKAQRQEIHEMLLDGSLDMLIGTHALIEDTVQFKQLGLAIIDEQHRFGVAQRSKLWQKSVVPPHVLVMTATPIPRTLAMSLYGDLDVSVIDELPPGRKPIQTLHKFESARGNLYHFMRSEIAKGRQIYVVYPLIRESEKLDLKDLMEGVDTLSREFPLPDYAISIVHGQMKPAEKDFEMKRFIEKQTQIMVATTVIEVGVNVPNASVMVIENAERFGLSQLHQLRGRVGRGAEQSFCILMTGNKLSKEAKKRMETMVRTNDGFEIAEVDLELRGPGDLMGTQQSGVLALKIADLVKDKAVLQQARIFATRLLQTDPGLVLPEHESTRQHLGRLMQDKNLWNFIS